MTGLKVRKFVDLFIVIVIPPILLALPPLLLYGGMPPSVVPAPTGLLSIYIVISVALFIAYGLFLPRRFEIMGNVVKLYAPLRREEHKVKQFVGEVEDVAPWRKWMFCATGWRFPFTAWAYCRDKT
ncbi:MAG: hypothetical protein ACK4M3_05095, partial [Pyrobaculum sp.]